MCTAGSVLPSLIQLFSLTLLEMTPVVCKASIAFLEYCSGILNLGSHALLLACACKVQGTDTQLNETMVVDNILRVLAYKYN